MTALLDELASRVLDSDGNGGWKRTVVDDLPELHRVELMGSYRQAWLSPTKLTIRDTREKRVVGGGVTSGEVAREYLRDTLAGRPSVPYRRDAMALTNRKPGYFFAGQTVGSLALVDVDACFASIYGRLTIDVVYRPATRPRLIGLGTHPFPRTDEWMVAKKPRNSAYGALVNPHLSEWRKGRHVEVSPNNFFAPDLVALIMDVTHSIAQETREKFGLVSWGVDGGIIPEDRADEWVTWLRERWAMGGSVRARGVGKAYGAVSWRIEDAMTLDVEHGHPHAWVEADTLRRLPGDLRDQLAELMRGTSREGESR